MSIQTKIFKKSFSFLEENLQKDFYCENFNEELTKKFYENLKEQFTKNEIMEYRHEIRKAFKSFFSLSRQHISIIFKGLNTIVLKDLKKNIFGESSQQFHQMSQNLIKLRSFLKDFEVSPGVFMLSKKELLKVECNYENVGDDSLKKELYRESAKLAFELDEKDLVFFMNEKLTIKKYIENQSGQDRRAYGLPVDELEKLKNIVFENNIQAEIQNMIDSLLASKLNFLVISNDYFRKHSIPLIQESLYKVASIYLNEDTHLELRRAFVNYILRENFMKIFKEFAKKLLELHAKREKRAEEFLRFYDGKVEIIDGVQALKPDIIDANEQRWNAVSILPIAIGKLRYDAEFEKLNMLLNKTDEKKQELEFQYLEAKEEHSKLVEVKNDFDKKLRKILNESKVLQDENYALKLERNRNGNNSTLDEEIEVLVSKIRGLQREENGIRAQAKDVNTLLSSAEIKTKNLNTELRVISRRFQEDERKIKNLSKTYAPIIHKYELIIDAVAKALMSKY